MPAAIEWTDEIKEHILDGIVSGEAICNILKRLQISEPTFYRFRTRDEEFDSTIARAQEMAQEANIDRTESLALTATPENWQVIQFQCRNAQWVAGKRKPKKYGEKLTQEVTGANGGPLQGAITVEFVRTGGN